MRAVPRQALTAVAAMVAALAVLAGVATAATPLVSTARNARLHATVLVDRSGRTLYHLSVERRGHFICANATCISIWKPLIVAQGVKPTGTVPLGTVRRPDGKLQVAYKGEPLYTFVQDRRRGDAKGEGFKDVGVWHAATVGAAASPSSGSGGGYHY